MERLQVNGKWYGKLDTEDEVKDLKASVIRRYKHSTKKNISAIYRDLRREGYDISYDTIRTWVKRSGAIIVRPTEYIDDGEKKSGTMLYLSNNLHGVLDGYAAHVTKSELAEFALRVVTGQKITDMICLFFEHGNVILVEKKEVITALFTADLSPADVKLLTGLVNMAEEQPSWIHFVKQYCKKAGINHYPT
jgi:hypothetical protein